MEAIRFWRFGACAGLALASLWAQAGNAQSGRPWVDPPRPSETPAPTLPTSPAAPPASEPQPAPAPAPPAEADPGSAAPPASAPTRPDRAAPAPKPAPESRSRPEDASPATPHPPSRSAEPPRPRPAPEPAEPNGRERRPRSSGFAEAAQELTLKYLAYWSAPNTVALDATPDFYAPQVLFYGRPMSARAVFEEKRRFVRRWPERDYRARPETMRTTCDPAPPICTVRTVFDFTAVSPRAGKRSQGSAILQLGISFAGGEPMIVFETSHVTSRGRSGTSETFEHGGDDQE